MKTKTTIITLAALSLGLATQAKNSNSNSGNSGNSPAAGGSGVVVTIPSAESQHQHANGETLTFGPKNDTNSDIWCYKVTGYNITLTTPDNKQQQGDVIGTIGEWEFITIDKPAQRQVSGEKVTFDPPRLISGKDLEIIFAFTNAAALTGTIDLNGEVYPSKATGADLGADIDAPVYALADDQPPIKWSLTPTFTE